MSTIPAGILLDHVRQIAAQHPDRQVSDRELLERFLQRRAEDAFAALLQRHGPMVLAVCRGAARDWHTAEDAFQATFLLLAQRGGAIRRRESVGSWLHGVARRIALKASARAARQHALEQRAPQTPPSDPLLDMSVRELQAVLHEELAKLPEQYRAPLVHCYLEGKTHEEAARQLGWTRGAVRGRLNRGREILRARLTRRGLAAPAGLLTLTLGVGSNALAFSQPLMHRTLRSAIAVSQGGAANVSAEVATLVSGAARTLAFTQRKVALALLLTLSVLGLGAGALAQRAWPAKRPAPAVPAENAGANKSNGADAPLVDRHGDPLPEGAIVRLGTVRLRHPEGVECVTFSPDGKTIACGAGGPIRFWDRATGKLLRQVHHKGRLTSIAYSPDGRWFASVGGEHVRVWNASSGKQKHEFPCATDFAVPNGISWLKSVPLVFSPDGATLASVNKDHVVLLWDLATGKERARLRGHEHEIHCLRFSPGGKTLVSVDGSRGRRDGSVRIWDPTTATTTGTVSLSASPSRTSRPFAVSPDGSTLAVEALEQVREKDGRVTHVYTAHGIRLVDTATGKERLRIKGKNSVVVSAIFSPDGNRLAFANRDNEVQVHEVKAGKLLHQFRQAPGGSTGGTYALAFAPDGKALVSSAEGAALHVWDLATGRERQDRPAHGSAVRAIAFTSDGRMVATASGDHTIRLWDAHTGKALALLRGHKRSIHALAFSPDGRRLASSSEDESVRQWDAATGRELHKVTLEGIKLGDGGCRSVSRTLAYTADGKGLLAAGGDLQFHHFATDTFKEVGNRAWRLSGGGKPPDGQADQFWEAPRASLSPDGRTAAVLAPTGLHFLDAASGQEFARADYKGGLDSLAFSLDGRTLLTGGWGKTLGLWEVATGKRIRSIPAPDFINAVAFSPDGRHVAAGCGWLDASIRIYDIASGKEAHACRGIGSYIGALSFSPDGRTLASGQRDTTALLWKVAVVPPKKGRPLGRAELEKLWSELQGDDAGRGNAAVWSLIEAPRSAEALLQDRLPAVPRATEKQLRDLIAALDAAAFAKREAAANELLRLGNDAESALRQALRGKLSAEARRRIEDLVKSPRRLPPTAEQRRRLRALAVLEKINSPAALRMLRSLARGAPAALETREAAAALIRLGNRDRSEP